MSKRQITVTKASGDKAVYSAEKLSRSLHKSGANDETIHSILEKIEPQLYDGITTKKIYKLAFDLLRRRSKQVASKYKLKPAIFELGPSGYPFENFVGEILRHQGYSVEVGQIVKGHCVDHEVDVLAMKDEKHFMIECKFHHNAGIICDVKIPLYILARFQDLEVQWKKEKDHKMKFHQGWVVTNTRFSVDAIQYGNCMGLHLLGWDYPKNDGLAEQVDRLKLYPVTCLHSITMFEKQKLLEKRIVLCKEIDKDDQILLSIGINPSRIPGIINEAKTLCGEIV